MNESFPKSRSSLIGGALAVRAPFCLAVKPMKASDGERVRKL